ncbi:MAG: ABC transporter permease [Solirubrobacterales bacterium]|nr:ABC transporter permease [Solirubrobacterales bacterium]
MIRLAGLRIRALFGFYAARIRQHPVQEMLAGAGIAVGVALVYAVMVSSASITGSAARVVEGVAGHAQLQVTARSDQGFDQRLAAEIRALDGVEDAAPLLRSNVMLVGPDGSRSTQMVGVSPTLAALGGELGPILADGDALGTGLAVSEGVAESLGVASGGSVELRADGRARMVPLSVLSPEVGGALAGSGAVVTSLRLAQRYANRDRRVSQVLVQTISGRRPAVERELERLAGGFANVTGVDAELAALRQATKPNDQSTQLFAAIGVMVGWLISFNAMLFTVAERRRFVTALRLEGASPRQPLTILGFEALLLGVLASGFGLLLGELLVRLIFDDVPDYLAFAFPVGSGRDFQPSIVVLCFLGGVLAAGLDAFYRGQAESREEIAPRTGRFLLWTALAVVAATTVVAVAVPAVTIVGGITLAVAAMLVMPVAFRFAAGWLERVTGSTSRLNMLSVALMELRGPTTRGVALTAVAAVAVYGSVAIGGARDDIVRGLDSHTRQWLSNADLWVTTGGQDLMINSFTAPDLDRLRAAEAVAAVRVHRGGFLDIGDRRLWLIGRPVDSPTMIPASQMLDGDIEQATARLRAGGWATASAAFANERGVEVGDRLRLPTPTGARSFRLAATTLNFGWIPGAVTINNRDYADAVGTVAPSALEVDLAPGTSAEAGRQAVEAALGPASGLTVQTRAEREAQYYDFGREGIARLDQIAALLLLAAALAVACALAAAAWQRRPRLAALKIQGATRTQLWRAMLCEAGVLVAIGCTVGLTLGVYGHLLAGRFVRSATGFASPFTLQADELLLAGGFVAVVALAVSAIPGWFAAGASARASFSE